MNVALIYPFGPKKMGLWPPLGLAYIAAVLEQYGHNVLLLDRASMQKRYYNPDKQTIKLLKSFNPELVGITATTPLFPDACHTAELIKKSNDVPVIIGGPHASALDTETLSSCKYFDYVGRGEGEFIIAEIANGIDATKICGITYRKNGEILRTPDCVPITDLDKLPLPARHLLDMDLYLRPTFDVVRGLKLRATHIFTARGCPFNCAFCAGSHVFGRGVRSCSVDRVVEEVKHLIVKYGVNGLYFAEDMFLFKKKRAIEICNRFINEGISNRITWCAQLHVNVCDEELLKIMKRAGCAQVEFGFESGSQKILNIMNKKSTVEQNYHAAEIAKKVGIRFLANIIVGVPGETGEDFKKTTKFLFDVQPDHLGFNRFVPLPGSPFYKQLHEEKAMHTDWSAYRVSTDDRDQDLNFSAMSNKEFYELFDEFRKAYFKKEDNNLRHKKRLQRIADQGFFSLHDPRFFFRKLARKLSFIK